MTQTKPVSPQANNDELQGEGNYTAAKEYDDATQAFVKSGKVEDAARNAAPKNAAEEREMLEAEEKGRAPAKPDLKQSRANHAQNANERSDAEKAGQNSTGKSPADE